MGENFLELFSGCILHIADFFFFFLPWSLIVFVSYFLIMKTALYLDLVALIIDDWLIVNVLNHEY